MENNDFEIEETNESAAQGAIDISETPATKGLVKLEETAVLPVIPETLLINGIEVNNKKLKDTIEKEVMAMKVLDLTDKKGYDAAEAKLKELSKLRTGSETWRTKKVMPSINKFGKDLKARIDEIGAFCKKGEEYLEEQLKPIREFAERERLRLEEEKDKLAEERAQEIISLGGAYDGKGTYKFSYDAGLFILEDKLRSYTPEEYENELADIKSAFIAEQKRLQDIEDAEQEEKNKLKTELSKLNEKRTTLRRKELRLEGYEMNAPGIYVLSDHIVTEEDILSLDDDAWDLLINPEEEESTIETVPAPVVEEKPTVGISYANRSSYGNGSPFAGISADIEDESPETPFIEAEPEKEPAPPTGLDALFFELGFTIEIPFIQFSLIPTLDQRIFPTEWDWCNDDLPAGSYQSGVINEELSFIVFKK